jgi:hypothetical protein
VLYYYWYDNIINGIILTMKRTRLRTSLNYNLNELD